MAKIVLALARDIGSANVVGAAVAALRAEGVEVKLYAEQGGLAAKHFAAAGWDYELADRIESLLAAAPSVVLTGLSSPRYLESELDRAARARGIPVANLEDYWGTHVRRSVAPDLVITIDDLSADLVRSALPAARVCIAGFVGINPVVPRSEIVAAFDRLRQTTGAKVIVFTDGDVMCEPGLRLLLASLKLTGHPWRLVPQFHPKYVDAIIPGSSQTWGERWESIVKPLRQRGLALDLGATGDEAALLADATVSSISTLLFRAAQAGKQALTVWTPELKPHLKRVCGLDQTPLMMMGFPVIRSPVSLDGMLSSVPPQLKTAPFDAKRAAQAVMSLVR